jgi:hypothetical protein
VDWTKILENSLGPLLGSFAGAAAALSSLWIKESLDRKRSVQEWFEEEIALKPADTVVELLHRWTHIILHQGSQSSLRVDFLSLPHLEIVRLQRILRSPALDRMFYTLCGVVFEIGPNVIDEDRRIIDWNHIATEVVFLRDVVLELQSQLLRERISRKADVEQLYRKKEISAIRARVECHVETWRPDKMFRMEPRISDMVADVSRFYQRLPDSSSPLRLTVDEAIALRDECGQLLERVKHADFFSMQTQVDGLARVYSSLDQIARGAPDK